MSLPDLPDYQTPAHLYKNWEDLPDLNPPDGFRVKYKNKKQPFNYCEQFLSLQWENYLKETLNIPQWKKHDK